MFTVTKALREYLEQNHEMSKELDEKQVVSFCWDLINDGKIEAKKITELTKQETPRDQLTKLISEEVSKHFTPVAGALDEIKKLMSGATTTEKTGEATATQTSDAIQRAMAGGAAAGEFEGSPDGIRVKAAIERYAHTPTAATWDKGGHRDYSVNRIGQPITRNADGLDYVANMPTPRTNAITGAWFLRMYEAATQRPLPRSIMTDHVRDILQWTVRNCEFVGYTGSYRAPQHVFERQIPDSYWQKALLDDSTSGGLEAVPIEFDANLITTPFLTGELLPDVTTRNVSRRRIEAAIMGQPTVSWGTAEGTEVGLFNTDSLVSAFDNTIWPVMGAMEIGRDFLHDSPIDIGAEVSRQYGLAFLSEFDTVIANGSGTDRPEGLFQKSGIGSVSSAGGAGAAPQIGDYEGLMFDIAKEYLQEAGMPPNSRAVFLSTQTSYSRARGIPVDSSTDARRLFGMNEHSYRLFDFRYAINSSAGNASIGFFCLNRYILYRVPGVQMEVVMNDVHSARANTETIVMRQRAGGALNDASAGTAIVDAEA